MDKNRVHFWDYMKAFAIILVIINHSLSDRSTLWFIGIIRMAVPIFILTSGFTFSLSIEKGDSVSAWYKPTKLFKKICYFSIPAVLTCAIYAFAKGMGVYGFIRAVILANYGLGSYYYNVLMQLIFIFPIIYVIVNRKRGGGIWIVAAVDLLYEAALYFMQIKVSYYRVISFRYLFIMALGVLLVEKHKFKRSKLICMFIVGAAWIVFFYLTPAEIFHYYPWENTNMICGLYIFPIMYFLYSKSGSGKIKIRWVHNMVSIIGRNTYFILMTQMMWFWVAGKIYSVVSLPVMMQVAVNVGVSCTIGCLAGGIYNMVFNSFYRRVCND